MVPFRKFNENIDFVLTSNMATHQFQNIHLPGIPVNSPLQEFVVFSDSEDELEYVNEVHGNLTKSVYTSKKQNVSIQCDIDKDVQLRDVLKFLSTCNFEKAKRSELDELMNILKWVSVKYNDIVKMSKTCLPSCKRKSPSDNDSENNEVKHSSDTTSKVNTPKKLKHFEAIIEKENLPTNLCEGTQISNEVNSESLRPNEDSSKRQIKTAQSKKKSDIGVKSSEATVENQMKGGSPKTRSHSKQEVKNLRERLSSNQDSSKKQAKTAQLKKEKDIAGKSNKPIVENQKKKGGSRKTQSQSPLKKCASDNLFKQPLVNNKALARNWMHRSHSFNFENTEKVKPHFTSYQSDIKVRKLYSPSEWLISEEFGKCSQVNN